jgi:hypothetical protein
VSVLAALPTIGQTVLVLGSVQFWERTCDAHGRCGLPNPISDRLPVSGEVTEPAGPGQYSVLRVPLTSGDQTVDFQIFWVMPPDGSTPYLVAQARLSEGPRLVTECTQYDDVRTEGYFPVGACSGFIPNENGNRQLGVTFFK